MGREDSGEGGQWGGRTGGRKNSGRKDSRGRVRGDSVEGRQKGGWDYREDGEPWTVRRSDSVARQDSGKGDQWTGRTVGRGGIVGRMDSEQGGQWGGRTVERCATVGGWWVMSTCGEGGQCDIVGQ